MSAVGRSGQSERLARCLANVTMCPDVEKLNLRPFDPRLEMVHYRLCELRGIVTAITIPSLKF